MVALILWQTSADLPMVWDEGNAIWRAEGIEAWWSRLWAASSNERAQLFDPAIIAHYWRYTTQLEGHPAFYGMVIAFGRRLAPDDVPPWQQARLGPIVLFALAAATVHYRLRRLYSSLTAWAAIGCVLLVPRLFAHVHFASIDGPLVSCWLLTWATFPYHALELSERSHPGSISGQGKGWFLQLRRRNLNALRLSASKAAEVAVDPENADAPSLGTTRITSFFNFLVFACCLGLALSCKFTGWVCLGVFGLWMLWRRGYRGLVWFGFCCVVSVVIFVLLNPPLWHEPWAGLAEFWRRNLDRRDYNVSVQFLGKLYDLYHPLPWYNTLVWVLAAVPLPIVTMAGLGAWDLWRNRRIQPANGLLLLCAVSLLVVRATPWAPPHDGLRLFLPSIAFVGLLAGCGVSWALRKIRQSYQNGSRIKAATIAGALGLGALGCVLNLYCYAPHWLSFYSVLIGGPRGARTLGMESTYYWDGLTSPVLNWLEEHTAADEKVAFSGPPAENLHLMKRWGRLGFEFRQNAPGEVRWYVLQHRPGAWQPEDWWLVNNARPVFESRLGSRCPCLSWLLDVPLVSIYDSRDYRRALEATRR